MKLTQPIRILMQPELISDSDEGLVGFARELAERFHLPTTLIKFVIVGGIGFIIYQAMFALIYDSPVFWFLPAKDTDTDLLIFTHPDIRLLIASIIGVEVAIFFQFNSHERWTFRRRDRGGNILVRFVKFNASSFVSPLIIVVTVNVMSTVFGTSPYIANFVGVGLGFLWNWTIGSMVIWPHLGKREEQPGPPLA
jgi:putative flippase GtrA